MRGWDDRTIDVLVAIRDARPSMRAVRSRWYRNVIPGDQRSVIRQPDRSGVDSVLNDDTKAQNDSLYMSPRPYFSSTTPSAGLCVWRVLLAI